MVSFMWFLSFAVLRVCETASVLQFVKYRKYTAAVITQNISASTMMTTVIGCERYYSARSTRSIVYDTRHQLCQLYEEHVFPLMILPDSSPPQTVYVKGTVYALVQTPMTWSNARINCEANGGQLIKIATPEKHEIVASLFLLYGETSDPISEYGPWIGLNDRSEEGSFCWADGSPLEAFSIWSPGEPNDSDGEDCVHIPLPGRMWNDQKCEKQLWSFCEYN